MMLVIQGLRLTLTEFEVLVFGPNEEFLPVGMKLSKKPRLKEYK